MSADRIYFGGKRGMGLSWAKYSELKNRDPKMLFGGVGGVFVEFEFGENRLFSIRPEVDWLSRGTKISDSDLDYKLKAKYVDVRLPLIFNFGDYQSVRPYVYVARLSALCVAVIYRSPNMVWIIKWMFLKPIWQTLILPVQ